MSQAWSFWSRSPAEVLQQLETVPQGLFGDEVCRRHLRDAHLLLKPKSGCPPMSYCFGNSPTDHSHPPGGRGLAFFLADPTDTAIIFMIVLASGLLGFWQERSANQAVASLLAIVQVKADVLRDGSPTSVLVEEVMPGDVVLLRAGDTVLGDCLLLESKDLFVDEAMFTGETYASRKSAAFCLPTFHWLDGRIVSFLETHVVSGNSTAVVVRIGSDMEFGKVSVRLQLRPRLASREMSEPEGMTKDDESDMTFSGFLLFEDPVKAMSWSRSAASGALVLP